MSWIDISTIIINQAIASEEFVVDEYSEKSYFKNRAYLPSSFVLDRVKLNIYRNTLYNVFTEDCQKTWNFSIKI